MQAEAPTLSLDDRFVRMLPGDPVEANRPRQVHAACWSPVAPTPAPDPKLLAVSPEVAELLGLPLPLTPALVEAFAGNRLLPGSRPYAACYGGHQFGQWAGQLGDGRAITLGEVAGPAGRFEVQLKGAGPTPYARHADGRAVLRSSVREFLCSEAMFHLGVPTTRALALLETGEPVRRDMFYDGHPRDERGAIVVRVAPTFLRFGSYEIFASRGDLDTLRRLVDFTIAEHFPHLAPASPASIVSMFGEVAERTAVLMAHWQRVGFVHGVMNTDNLSILGATIDYGPYGWLEGYDPEWTPNTTDAGGRRYRFGHQPAVAGWNLARLAEALVPLVGAVEPFQQALDRYGAWMQEALRISWSGKLGLRLRADDQGLLNELLAVLRLVETDYTLFFRGLPDVRPADDDEALLAPFAPAFYVAPERDARARIARWVRAWLARADEDAPDPERRRAAMNAVNPKFVLRNWLAQLAIDRAEEGDPSGITELLDVLRRPYDDQPGSERFAVRRPEWAPAPGRLLDAQLQLLMPPKAEVVAALRETLRAELAQLDRVTAMARDEATSAESRPENQYDTRALEASYLAAGQGERLTALRRLLAWAEVLGADPTDAIETGALAEVEVDAGSQWVLFAPRGGTELVVGGVAVRVVSVGSPLGVALCGLGAGDTGEVETPRGPQSWRIRTVE